MRPIDVGQILDELGHQKEGKHQKEDDHGHNLDVVLRRRAEIAFHKRILLHQLGRKQR